MLSVVSNTIKLYGATAASARIIFLNPIGFSKRVFVQPYVVIQELQAPTGSSIIDVGKEQQLLMHDKSQF